MEIKIGFDGFCIRPVRRAEKMIYAYRYKCLWNRDYTTRNMSGCYLNDVLLHIKRI